MALRLSPPLAAAAAAAILLSGCGKAKVDTAQIRSVVHQFAESHDAGACNLLSQHALVNLYGGYKKKNASKARSLCVARAKNFKSEQVGIDTLEVIDENRARVEAHSIGRDITYGVSLHRYGTTWRIEAISQAKAD
jgi:hypothetical protein